MYSYSNSVLTIMKKYPNILSELLLQSNIPITNFITNGKDIGGDYIDKIHPNMLDNCVMVGVDDWKRPFVSFRLKFKLPTQEKCQTHVYTFFQRRANYPSWAMGSTGPDILQVAESPFKMSGSPDASCTANQRAPSLLPARRAYRSAAPASSSPYDYQWKAHIYLAISELLSTGSAKYKDINIYLV